MRVHLWRGGFTDALACSLMHALIFPLMYYLLTHSLTHSLTHVRSTNFTTAAGDGSVQRDHQDDDHNSYHCWPKTTTLIMQDNKDHARQQAQGAVSSVTAV